MFARQNVPAKSSINNIVVLEMFRKLQHSPITNSTIPAADPHALYLGHRPPGEPTVALITVWGLQKL